MRFVAAGCHLKGKQKLKKYGKVARMVRLRSYFHPNLTEYVVKLLADNRIVDVIQFLREDSDKLCRVTNLTLYEVTQIKKHLLKDHGVRSVSGDQLYKLSVRQAHLIPTGVKCLDDLFDGGLPTGNIIEFCGLPEAGKTQLCNTIAVNVSYTLKLESLYIDTKYDFSGRRVRNMLLAKDLPPTRISEAMQRIRVQRVDTVEKLLELLTKLEKFAKSNERLKIVIIDSLPSLFFIYHGDDRLEGKTLQAEMTCRLRKLASQFHLVIIVVNLMTNWMEWTMEENETIRSQTQKPSLGKYWQTVPSVRLLIEAVEATTTTSSAAAASTSSSLISKGPFICLVKILKSDFYKTGKYCHVQLTNMGAISVDATTSTAAAKTS